MNWHGTKTNYSRTENESWKRMPFKLSATDRWQKNYSYRNKISSYIESLCSYMCDVSLCPKVEEKRRYCLKYQFTSVQINYQSLFDRENANGRLKCCFFMLHGNPRGKKMHMKPDSKFRFLVNGFRNFHVVAFATESSSSKRSCRTHLIAVFALSLLIMNIQNMSATVDTLTKLKLSANSLPIRHLPIRPAETVCQFK